MAEGILSGPGDGEVLRNEKGNRTVLVKGTFPHVSVFEFTLEGPFDGPDPHTHDGETDSFYVLEGEVDFFLGGEWTRHGPGTFFSAPPGVEHAFAKHDAGTARLLNIHAPGGFEHELRDISV
jgi:quercetin dioxygenase-like cupin family protein